MPIAAITKQGLGSMAILVAVLWGCLVSERLTIWRANLELSGALREIERLHVKVRHQPAARPVHARRAESA